MLHSSVVTVPDPLETTMGKSFDMAVAALLAAYQARGYDLDGFAFSWEPRKADAASGAVQSTKTYRERHRGVPSLLLFRKDLWRNDGAQTADSAQGRVETPGTVSVAYDLVYLVGDSPGYGIQPRAFAAAAQCALRFNDTTATVSALSPGEPCNQAPAPGRRRTLNVIGPSFSGSMQSLAVAIGRLGCDGQACGASGRRSDIDVKLVSPSASVQTNNDITSEAFVARHGLILGTPVEYATLASSLDDQMKSLVSYLCSNDLLPERKIVLLVEQSTFGRGAGNLADPLIATVRSGSDVVKAHCLGDKELSVDVKPFPPNIASIRAEHSRLRKAELAANQKAPTGTNRLLELDMTSAEAGTDRPPTYQPALSSRADELMLYRMFDTLRVWGKPNVVVIVATDVRDRLFLLSEVRKTLPSALPAMLEMDYLMVHPDYRAASRGAVIVPMQDPTVCVREGKIEPCRPWGASAAARELSRCGAPEPLQWVCMFIRDREQREAHSIPGRNGNQSPPAPGSAGGEKNRSRSMRIPFSTDQAANMFRAAYLLVGYRERPVEEARTRLSDYIKDAVCSGSDCVPTPYVATLAGFNTLEGDYRSNMVAADSRLALQLLWYLAVALLGAFFFLVGAWLFRGAPGGSVMSNFSRRVITDSRWLTRGMPRWLVSRDEGPPARSGPAPIRDPEAVASLVPKTRILQGLVAVVAAAVALGALLRLWQVSRWGGSDALLDPCLARSSCRFSLAHGRDVWAVYCLWGLYACLAIVGAIRLCIAGRRHDVYARQLQWPGAGESTRPWLVPVVVLLIVVVAFYFSDNPPVSVDPRSPWLLAMLGLVCSVAFLVTLGSHVRYLGRITLWLSRSIPPVQKRKGLSDWPNPRALQETTQTPFNLSMLRKDVAVLKANPLREWLHTTRLIIDGNGVYPAHASSFEEWQRQLVAELKLLVVAIRFSAWCAMAAPLVVLLAMTAYPPVYERWLRTMSIGLLLMAFLLTIIVVLRLEKDPMLGPMFTRHGDDLSFGGALRALWPKFVAMGAVLVPLVLPDVWESLHTLIRSINSLG
ncbi:MAG TPA: hypothetical protein VGD42_01140 [Lysobacter sp.]